ncbi:angiomotin-like isoform X1 [Tachysurus ichikawai]
MYRYSGIQVQVLPPSTEEEWCLFADKDERNLESRTRWNLWETPDGKSGDKMAATMPVSAPTPKMATVLPAPVFKRATTVSTPAVKRAAVLTTPVPQRAVTIPAPVVKMAAFPASQPLHKMAATSEPLPKMAASPTSPVPVKPQLLVSSLLDPQMTSVRVSNSRNPVMPSLMTPRATKRYSGIQVQVLPPSTKEEWWDRLDDLMSFRQQGRAQFRKPNPMELVGNPGDKMATTMPVSAPTPKMATVLPAPVFKRATTVSAPAVKRAAVLTTPVPQRAVTIPAPVVKMAAIPASQPLQNGCHIRATPQHGCLTYLSCSCKATTTSV